MRVSALAVVVILAVSSVLVGGIPCEVTALFTSPPGDGAIRQAILSAIQSATESIFVAMYSMADEGLVAALEEAARDRHVAVEVLLDNGQAASNMDLAQDLKRAGATVYLDQEPGDLHHKFIVVDLQTVITGSYNWSGNAARDNFENVVILSCPELAEQFHQKILDMLAACAFVDLATLSASTPRDMTECAYVGNANTGTFHRPSCQSVQQMAEGNKVCLHSRDEAVLNGYHPCGICNP